MKYRIVPVGESEWGVQKCEKSYRREELRRFFFWTRIVEVHVPEGYYDRQSWRWIAGDPFKSLEAAKEWIDLALGLDPATQKRKRIERERRAECPYIDYPEYY